MRLFAFSLLVASVVFLPSCGEKEKVKLRLNLPKGYSVKVRVIIEGKNTNEQESRNITTKNSEEKEYLLECVEVDANDVMIIKKTWLSVKSKMEYGEGKGWQTMIDFDSTRKEDKGKPFYLRHVIGKSILVKVKPDGMILNSEGIEELAEEYIKADEARGAKYEPKMREKLKAGLCTNYQNLSGVLAYYPQQGVKAGQSWSGPWGRCGGDKCLVSKWALTKVKNGIAHIEIKDIDVPVPVAKQDGLKKKTDLKQNNNIKLQLDLKTGLIKTCEGCTETRGTIKQWSEELSEDNAKTTKMVAEGNFRIETVREK